MPKTTSFRVYVTDNYIGFTVYADNFKIDKDGLIFFYRSNRIVCAGSDCTFVKINDSTLDITVWEKEKLSPLQQVNHDLAAEDWDEEKEFSY